MPGRQVIELEGGQRATTIPNSEGADVQPLLPHRGGDSDALQHVERKRMGVNHRCARRRLSLWRLLDENWTKAVAGERQGQRHSHRAGTHNQNVCRLGQHVGFLRLQHHPVGAADRRSGNPAPGRSHPGFRQGEGSA